MIMMLSWDFWRLRILHISLQLFYPLSPISPRVTYILCKQGLGDQTSH